MKARRSRPGLRWSSSYLQLPQHLEGQQLLPQVIAAFHDDRQEPPGREVAIGRGFSDPPERDGESEDTRSQGSSVPAGSSTYRTFSSHGSFRATAEGSSGSRLKVVGA